MSKNIKVFQKCAVILLVRFKKERSTNMVRVDKNRELSNSIPNTTGQTSKAEKSKEPPKSIRYNVPF